MIKSYLIDPDEVIVVPDIVRNVLRLDVVDIYEYMISRYLQAESESSTAAIGEFKSDFHDFITQANENAADTGVSDDEISEALDALGDCMHAELICKTNSIRCIVRSNLLEKRTTRLKSIEQGPGGNLKVNLETLD